MKRKTKLSGFMAFVLTAAMVLTMMPTTVFASETAPAAQADRNLNLSNGSIVITETGYTQGDREETAYTGNYTISQNESTTATKNTITVKGGTHTITLSGVNIDVSKNVNDGEIPCAFAIESGDVTVLLASDTTNTLKSGGKDTGKNAWNSMNAYAGLWVKKGANLIIGNADDTAAGTLNSYGASYKSTTNPIYSSGGAGIGGSYIAGGAEGAMGTVTINSGTILAEGGTSGRCGAGIGKAAGDSGTDVSIIINGGSVTANGSGQAAGIGGAYGGSNGSVEIHGGTVTATAKGSGAGIGAGNTASWKSVLIKAGTITAEAKGNGAGIGSGAANEWGNDGSIDSITIKGGTVTAKSGSYGAGIGGGGYSSSSGKLKNPGGSNSGVITISGGTVAATGGTHGPGIGSGSVQTSDSSLTSNSKMDAITISGGTITAKNGSSYNGSSYKLNNNDTGIGLGENAGSEAAAAYENWSVTTAEGDALDLIQAGSETSIERNGKDFQAGILKIGDDSFYVLPEGYYTIGSSTGTLIAGTDEKSAADTLINKLKVVQLDQLNTDSIAEIASYEAEYNQLSDSLQYYVDKETKSDGKTLAEIKAKLKERLKDQNVPITIKLNTNGGAFEDGTTAPNSVAYGSTFTFPVPVRDNYVFEGWYIDKKQITDETGKSKVGDWEYLSEQALTAHWKSEIEGTGSEDAPYVLKSAANFIALSRISHGTNTEEELALFSGAENAGSLLSKNFKLGNDVTLRTSEGFYGIGGAVNVEGFVKGSSSSFKGTFDGNGKTITLDIDTTGKINTTDNASASSTNNGKVNVAPEGKTETYVSVTGGIFNNANGAVLKNIKTDGSVKLVANNMIGGGIVGTFNEGSISDCENKANVTLGATFNTTYGGGIAGQISGSKDAVEVKNCSNSGEIICGSNFEKTEILSQGNTGAGGICGLSGGSAELSFTNCKNTGAVTATRSTERTGRYSVAAGIVGNGNGTGKAAYSDCENSGTIKADAQSSNCAAGIVGRPASETDMSGCKNSGAISANEGIAGALIAETATSNVFKGSFKDCYHVMTASDQNAGWKLSDDTNVIVTNSKLEIQVTSEGENYYQEERYVTDANGNKAADIFSADNHKVYITLDHNNNLLNEEKPFQTKNTAYVIASADDYYCLVEALREDENAQKKILGRRFSSYSASEKATILAAAHVKITKDFTLSSADTGKLGLGTDAHPFSGTVYGQNHTITYNIHENSLKETQTDTIGFIGVSESGAQIENLNFAGNINVATTADNGNNIYAGAAVAKGSNGKVTACKSTVSITIVHNTTVQNATGGMVYAGGLVGYQNETGAAVLANCSFDGSISVTAPKNPCAGGLAGMFGGEIKDCTAKGDITATLEKKDIPSYGEDAYAGGLAGIMSGTIDNSTAAGTVQSASDWDAANRYAYAGGLTGKSSRGITVENCAALTTVSAENTGAATSIKRGGLIGNGTVTAEGTNWSVQTSDIGAVTGVNAINTTVLESGMLEDVKELYEGALPGGIELTSAIADLNVSDGKVTYTKADTGTISLSYDGQVFYTSANITVSPKTLAADDVVITGISSSYASDDAAEEDSDIEVIYKGQPLTEGTDYTVRQDKNGHKFTITFQGNYIGSVEKSYEIKNTLTVTASKYEAVYDGKAHGITLKVPDGATVSYGTSDSEANESTAPTYKNAGTYVVYYKVTRDSEIVTGSEAVIISKKAATVTADNKTIYVGDKLPAFTYTVSGLVEEDKITAEASCDATSDKAGTYPITVSVTEGNSNYDITCQDGTLTVSNRSYTDPLASSRYDAKKELDDYVNLSDYDAEGQSAVKKLIADAKTAIDKAVSKDEISKIVTEAKDGIDKIETNADKTGQNAAKKELDAYVDLNAYDAEERAAIEKLIADAKAAIDKASGKDEIAKIVAQVKGEIDQIPTTDGKADLTNADLKELKLSKGTLSPKFDKEKLSYTAVVPNSVKSVTISALPVSGSAAVTVKVNGKEAKAEAISLKEGVNTIIVTVTAGDGTTVKTYTVKVTRAAAKGSTKTISGLKYKVTKDSVTSGTVTFTGYSGNKLTKVSVPKTVKIYGITYKVTAIDKNACRNKTKLKTVTVGDNVTKIGNAAFYKCANLKTITIGKNVTSIGNHVFCHDTKLRTMTINSTKLAKVGTHTLYKVRNLTIKAPKSKVTKYKKLFKGKAAKSYRVVKK